MKRTIIEPCGEIMPKTDRDLAQAYKRKIERKISCDLQAEPLDEALAYLDSLAKVGFQMESAPDKSLRMPAK